MEKEIDFLAIGDITNDAFIRIKDASVNCDINHEHCRLCVKFGAKIPYEFVEVVRAVGNSANAAVSAARLGVSSGLIANIGEDQSGHECIDELRHNHVATDLVHAERGKKTNYHYVLWYEEERTILVKHEDFHYTLPQFKEPSWIYLSSLSDHSLPYHDEIANYVEAHPKVRLVFQPGTFQIKLGFERLKKLYARTELFFCNKEEAQEILQTENHDLKDLLNMMHEKGPKIVVITDGPKGAYAYDGERYFSIPAYPDPKPPYERTRAGDAFASTIAAALALGEPLERALLWGPINSMSVVQYIGAQKGLLSREQIEQYLEQAPSNYKVESL